MRRRTVSSFFMAAGLMVGLAACGGGPTGTNSGDPLTDAEVQALFTELSAAFSTAGVSPALSRVATPGLNLNSSAPIPVNGDFNQSVTCRGGGTVSLAGSVNGTIDDQTFEGGFRITLAWDLAACVVPAETTTFTADGDPEIEFTGDFNLGQDEFSVSGTQVGGFKYTTSDDRIGSCAIDVTFNVSVNSTTQEVTESVSGEVCGRSASQFSTFTIG